MVKLKLYSRYGLDQMQYELNAINAKVNKTDFPHACTVSSSILIDRTQMNFHQRAIKTTTKNNDSIGSF